MPQVFFSRKPRSPIRVTPVTLPVLVEACRLPASEVLGPRVVRIQVAQLFFFYWAQESPKLALNSSRPKGAPSLRTERCLKFELPPKMPTPKLQAIGVPASNLKSPALGRLQLYSARLLESSAEPKSPTFTFTRLQPSLDGPRRFGHQALARRSPNKLGLYIA